jgi:hypothetical protein
MAAGASGAAGAAALIIQAVKASGVLVRVNEDAFLQIVARQESPLVVCAPANFLRRFINQNCQYITSYKGLAFHTLSRDHLQLPEGAEVVLADSIWMPG